MTRVRWYGPTLLLLSTTLLVMLTGPRLAREIAHAHTEARIELIKNGLSENASLADLSDSFRRIAQVVEPSVVHIQISTKRSPRRERGRSLEEDLLRRFFKRHPRDPMQRDDEDEPQEQDDDHNYDRFNVPRLQGNGSGWVYDDLGHIITNHHVIDDADVIKIRFHDGTELEATVVGTDPKTDVAVIKVDTDDLYPATIAPHPVEQGDIVFAFGSPFRFDFSMSQGIVSAKGRRLGLLAERGGYENFIQTDAAVNPGNSGGPLTNIYGQVIGMNTAIATRTGTYNGIGFAIPVKMVANIADQLIQRGKVSRGYLGIYIGDLNPQLAKTFGYDGKGVLVENPIDGGPAVEAGVKRGDIISHVNDQPVETAEALRHMVAAFPPGTDLELAIFRDGEPLEITVTLGELQDSFASAETSNKNEDPADDDQGLILLRKLGIESVANISDQLVERYDLKDTDGVIVRRVRPGSTANAAGILPRQIITHVMGIKVRSIDGLVQELGKHDLTQGARVSIMDPQTKSRRFVLLALPDQ